MRVLIVDDMAAVREGLRLLFGDAPGVETVSETADAQQALHLLETLQPEVVLLDIEMRDSLQVARQVKTLPRPPLLVALSVYSDDELRRRAASVGADLYMDKSLLLHNVVKLVLEKAERAASTANRPDPGTGPAEAGSGPA